MEKWKIITIIALLAALPVYGYIQSLPPAPPVQPGTPTGTAGPTPPGPPPKVVTLVGKPAPSWNIAPAQWANTPKPIKLEELRGHVVLLEFWRAECSHCQEAAPNIEILAEKYKDKGLRVIGLHSPVTKDGVNEFDWTSVQQKAKELGIKYPIGMDNGRKNFNAFKGEKFPTFILIDPKGIVRYADNGFLPNKYQALIDAIEKLFGGSTETAKAAPTAAKP